MTIVAKKCLLEVETVRYQCQNVLSNVQTLRHQSDGAEISWVLSVLGPKWNRGIYFSWYQYC